MLHVIFTPPFDELLKSASYLTAKFVIGQSTKDINPDLVQSVLADGPELDFIYEYFGQGLPLRLRTPEQFKINPSTTWFGDDAKFIVANWT